MVERVGEDSGVDSERGVSDPAVPATVLDAELLELLYVLKTIGKDVRYASAGIGSRFPDEAQLVVVTTDGAADAVRLGSTGARILGATGSVFVAEVPIDALPEIAAVNGVLEVRLSRRLSPKLAEAQRLSRLSDYQAHLSPGGRGKGVVIGIIDSGIDGTHPAFEGRLVECWNQIVKPEEEDGRMPFGRIESAEMMADGDGHGTHVASIAAGNMPDVCGFAPEASIIAVRTDWEDARIILGIDYVFRRASELGMPAVVNLSLGGHGDPHDGTDALSRAIDLATGPGRVVVAAAGNEGLDNIHVQRTLQTGTTSCIPFRVPYNAQRVVLNLWYDGSGDVEVAVSTPFGPSTPYQGSRADQPTEIYALGSQGRVIITTPPASLLNGDKGIRIALQSLSWTVQPGRWFLHARCVAGPVTLHGWTIDDSPWGDVTWVDSTNTHLIGSPGAAARAITAAAVISRTEWRTEDGKDWSLKFERKAVAPFSSCGPLRNGRKKPDFAVGAGMTIAARSAQAEYDADMPVDRYRAAMAGTSMASAALAGICATLLERHPDWGPDEVVTTLKKASLRIA